jgi:hypothetical protein
MDKLALHSPQKTPVKVKAKGVKINTESDVVLESAKDWSPQQLLSPQMTGEKALRRNSMPSKYHEYPVTPPALKVQSENGGGGIGSGDKTNVFESPSTNNDNYNYIATPIQTPTSIRRLKPSPREIKKSRFSPPFFAKEG